MSGTVRPPLPPVPAPTRTSKRGPNWLEHVDDAGRRWAEPRTGFPRDQQHGGDYYDTFCAYCQRPFAQLGRFRRHVIDKHGESLAKRLGLLPLESGENLPTV